MAFPMWRGVARLLAIAVLLVEVATASQHAWASQGRRFSPAVRYTSAVNLTAVKYFTVNLRPGLTAAEVEQVAHYFRAYGMIVSVSSDANVLFVQGTYGQAGASAHTGFARYEIGGRRFVSTTGAETFPPIVAARILATTINDGPPARPFNLLRPAGFFDPSGGFTPKQYQGFYDFNPILSAGINGSGQAAAIFACATVSTSDISLFESTFGIASNSFTVVNVDGGTTTTDFEPTGDIERELSSAPKEKIYLYVVPDDCSFGEMADALAQMASDFASKKFESVNISYGASEDDFVSAGATSDETAIDTDLHTLFTKGVTVFVASGDSGSFEDTQSGFWFTPGEITVNYPASDRYVMAVGGTTSFTTSTASSTRLSENAWSGSGGGVSATWTIPGRQIGVPGLASTTMRNVPDVALNADLNTGYQLVFESSVTLAGGTSFASPGWAGFLALVNQKRVAMGKAVLPSAPSNIYLERGTTGFLDISNGSNGFYNAKSGYDNVTGLGVLDASKLYNSLIALP